MNFPVIYSTRIAIHTHTHTTGKSVTNTISHVFTCAETVYGVVNRACGIHSCLGGEGGEGREGEVGTV